MKKSFTLIELLVVIAIIGVLSGIIIVTMSGATDKAIIAKAQAFSSSTRNSMGTNIISEYKFDGTSVTTEGNAAASDYLLDTWNQNNLTATNLPTVLLGTSCISGSCLNFSSASSQCLTASDASLLNVGSQITAMFWIKGATQYKVLLAQGDESNNTVSWMVQGDYDEYRRMEIWLSDNGTWNTGHNEGFRTTANIFDSKWHLIGFSFNAGVIKTYIDGESVPYTTEGTMGTTLYNTSDNLTIGCGLDNGAKAHFLNGQIDDVRLYSIAISAGQVKEQYYAGLNKLLANKQITDEEYLTRISKLEQHSASN